MGRPADVVRPLVKKGRVRCLSYRQRADPATGSVDVLRP